jgi:threonine/homoserine/homoserine lactone efflux protein
VYNPLPRFPRPCRVNLHFLLKGIVVGAAIAAPVGPIGVICIRRTLTEGRRNGFICGLGAATADAAYGCVAGFGLTAISSWLIRGQFWLGLGGGIFLIYLGVRTIWSKTPETALIPARAPLTSAFLSTFLLTLANPLTILSFLAVFAGLGLGNTPGYQAALALVVGIFGGSALWWLTLSSLVSILRAQINQHWLRLINFACGVLICAFGVWALMSVALRPAA